MKNFLSLLGLLFLIPGMTSHARTSISPCPTSLPGFTELGEYNNSKYFLSSNTATWPAAQANAQAQGAYLVSINDQAENEFLRAAVGNNIYFIGLSDAQTEGNLTWDSGEPLSYNVSGGNNEAGDYGVLYFWDGSWGFENAAVWRHYIVEVPCGNSPTDELTLETCPEDIAFSAPPGATYPLTAEWEEPTASTTCPDGEVTIVQTQGPVSGSLFILSQLYQIEYEITDNCGNVTTCAFTVLISSTPFNPDVFCPNDIEVNVAQGETGALVTWDENDIAISQCGILNKTQTAGLPNGSFFPIGTSTLTYEVEVSCPWGVTFFRECSFQIIINGASSCPNVLPGFEILGEYNNSKYFLSDSPATGPAAQAAAAAVGNGAYLASINDQAENDFLHGVIGSNIYFIGLSDAQNEGTLTWDSGEPFSFDKSVNNSDAGDFGVLYFWDGTWGFENSSVWRQYIVEVPCAGNPPGGDLTIDFCSDDLELGIPFDVNSFWPISFPAPMASTTCPDSVVNIVQTEGPANGSTVAVGLDYTIVFEISDNCGNVETCSFVVSFFNVLPNINLQCPTDMDITVAAGESGAVVTWDENDITVDAPCVINNLVQISGPSSGSFFPLGTTTIEYQVYGNCFAYSYQTSCSFNIIISEENTSECPPSLVAYTLLGEFNNSKYFLSDHSATWPNAQAAAAASGGYLASINDQTENDFLRSQVGNHLYFIGLTDVANEGTLSWDSGEALTYDRSQGNNSNSDFGVLHFWDGSWGLEGAGVWRRYIVEVPCSNTPPDNSADLTQANLYHVNKEELLESQVSLFPNPVMHQLHVNINSTIDREEVLLQIYDSRGNLQIVKRINLWAGENQILLDTDVLTGGMYYLLLPELPTRKYSAPFVKVVD